MNQKELKCRIRSNVLLGAAVFTITVVSIIIGHNISGRINSFDTNYSISRYVGLTYFSSLVFLICNCFLAFQFIRVFKLITILHTGEKLSFKELPRPEKLQFVVGCVIAALLVILSICPLGLFDAAWGDFGLVSRIHQISSRTMFALMAVYAAYGVALDRKSFDRESLNHKSLNRKSLDHKTFVHKLLNLKSLKQQLSSKKAVVSTLFVAYMFVVVIFYLVTPSNPLGPLDFIFETAYIYWFFIILLFP